MTIVIRKHQQKLLEADVRRRRFVDPLAAMMEKLWPEQCERLGREGVRLRIEAGLEKAAGHGIREQTNMTRYVHLVFLLDDEDFDTAPGTEWAGTILAWKCGENMKLAALEKRAQDEALKRS
jgi:hypothetical protein